MSVRSTWDLMEGTMFDAGRRPIGRLFYWVLLVIAASGFRLPAFGAGPVPQSGPATTTVADTVYLADGTTATGTLIIIWPAFVTAGGAAVAGNSTTTTLGTGGALSVALVPNAGATPANTYYTVVYQIGAGEVKTEYWVVPTTSPATLAMVRTTPGAGIAGQPVSVQYVNSELATVVHLAGTETITGTKTFSASPGVPTPTNPGDIANKGYVDASVTDLGSGIFLPTAGGTMSGPITLPGNPSAPLQAAPKQYVDLGLTSKADLISGLVPANELGTGTASSATCLLGNGTWGACASGGGTGNVSTAPGAGVSQNITQAVGTQFSTNNLAGIPYVVSSYNWPQGGSPAESCTAGCIAGALVSGTLATITLTPCPAGIDTSNNTKAPYGVYISGTGTAEAVAVTGGSCTSGGSSGTILFTPGNNHAAGFTVGAANGGNQEAINVADGGNSVQGTTIGGYPSAVIKEVPAGQIAANYNIYWPVYLNSGKTQLDGFGAMWQCYTRSACLVAGNYAGATVGHNTIQGIALQPALSVDGAQISSVSAASGIYTVTTATSHNLISGDYAILYYSTPAQTQEAKVQVTFVSNTQFTYQIGSSTTFSTSSGFGWVALEDAAIEDITDGLKLVDIKLNGASTITNHFNQGVVVGNDQDFTWDGGTNLGSNVIRCDAAFCGNMLYLRGDQGIAPVVYVHHLEASLQCSGNGIRNSSGNTMKVADSVIQGFNQYGIYYANGLQSAESDNVYEESGNCVNGSYPANGGTSQESQAGYIINGPPFTLAGNAPVGGIIPEFAAGGSCSTVERNYYVVIHDTNLGTSPMLYFGYACPASTGTSIPLAWPNPDLAGGGTRTFDILATVGTSGVAAPYGTGNFAITGLVGISATCTTAGICTATDIQPTFASYMVPSISSWVPKLPFWPGAVVLGNGSTLFADQILQSGLYVSTSYQARIFAKRCATGGNAGAAFSPFWAICPGGDSSGNANKNVGAEVWQLGPATGVGPSGATGGLNLNLGAGGNVIPRQLITTLDGNPVQTFATPGYVRAGSALDSFIGTDTTGGIGTQDQTYGAPGGHNFYVNDPGTNSSHAKLNIAATAATFNVPLTVNGNLSVASGSVTLPITGSGSQCLHVSATGAVTGTGLDCATVNSGGASQVAMYSSSGAVLSGDSALTDTGTVLSYSGTGGIAAATGTFSGNVIVNGQLQVAGPWMIESPIPGTAMAAAGAGTSSMGISNDGNFYISANAGTPLQIATTGTSSHFTNLFQEDSYDLGQFVVGETSPQALHVYSSYTNSSTWQRTSVGFDPASGYAVLKSENSTSGAAPGLGFWVNSNLKWVIDSTSNLKPWADEAYDIGTFNASTGVALRPATIYVAGNTSSNSGFELGKFASNSYELCNDTTNGTVIDGLAVLTSAGCAVKPSAAATSGVIGVVIANAGTSGTVTLVRTGSAFCNFDATATVAGDYVVPSPTQNPSGSGFYPLCHDAGSTLPNGSQVLGRVLQATSGGTTAQMFFDMPGSTAGPSAVSSVFGRTGAVTATSGDYAVAQVTGAAPLASPGLTGTPTAPTAAANTSTTQIATTAFVMGELPAAGSGTPWVTAVHGASVAQFSSTANKASFYGVVLAFPKTTTQISYFVATADTSSSTYDLGIFSGTSAGTCTLVAHTGSIAGSTSMTSGWHTVSWTGGSVTLQPGRYYLALTSSATTAQAQIYGDNSGLTFVGGQGGVSVTTGGTLPGSLTCPADSPTFGLVPAWLVN